MCLTVIECFKVNKLHTVGGGIFILESKHIFLNLKKLMESSVKHKILQRMIKNKVFDRMLTFTLDGNELIRRLAGKHLMTVTCPRQSELVHTMHI